MRLHFVLLFVTTLAAALALSSCTLITEVDRGLIGEGGAGGAGGMGGATP